MIQSARVGMTSLNSFGWDKASPLRRICATVLDDAGISGSDSTEIRFSTVVLFQIHREHCWINGVNTATRDGATSSIR